MVQPLSCSSPCIFIYFGNSFILAVLTISFPAQIPAVLMFPRVAMSCLFHTTAGETMTPRRIHAKQLHNPKPTLQDEIHLKCWIVSVGRGRHCQLKACFLAREWSKLPFCMCSSMWRPACSHQPEFQKNAIFCPQKNYSNMNPPKGEGVDVNFPFQRAVCWGSMFIFAGVIFETFHKALLGCNPPSLTDWSSAPPFLRPLSWKKSSESSPKKGLILGTPIHPSFSKRCCWRCAIVFPVFFWWGVGKLGLEEQN